MKTRIQLGLTSSAVCLLAIVLAAPCRGEQLPVQESAFGKSLVPGKFILPAKDGWWNWGMAPIYDERGKLHIFNSSIPYMGESGMGHWQSKSRDASRGVGLGNRD